MIDFHNHILPGVDDGAKSMEESIEMLRCAENQGITDVVNTVHYQHPKMEGKNTNFDYICSVKDELLEEMSKENININIHLGSEVFFNFNLFDILDNPLTTFCNGKYMLIEFPTNLMPDGYDNHLYDLKMSGVTPIIAHPERYKPVQTDISIIEKLIDSGCIIQIDAGSILGYFGDRCKITADIIVSRNMAHILGSDSHGIGKRNFCLYDSIQKIKKKTDYDVMNLVSTNPLAIIKGEILDIPDYYSIKKNNVIARIKNFFIK